MIKLIFKSARPHCLFEAHRSRPNAVSRKSTAQPTANKKLLPVLKKVSSFMLNKVVIQNFTGFVLPYVSSKPRKLLYPCGQPFWQYCFFINAKVSSGISSPLKYSLQ
jgi:hypothetical protein